MTDLGYGNNLFSHYLSAYGIAVKHGFAGSEAEWLRSLCGKPGQRVELRVNAGTGALEQRREGESEWAVLMTPAQMRGDSFETAVAEAKASAGAAATHAGEAIASERAAQAAAEDAAYWADAARRVCFTVRLLIGGWVDNVQVIEDARFVAGRFAYLVYPDGASYDEYLAAGMRAMDVSEDGRMEFRCVNAPMAAVNVHILRMEADDA